MEETFYIHETPISFIIAHIFNGISGTFLLEPWSEFLGKAGWGGEHLRRHTLFRQTNAPGAEAENEPLPFAEFNETYFLNS